MQLKIINRCPALYTVYILYIRYPCMFIYFFKKNKKKLYKAIYVMYTYIHIYKYLTGT